MMKRLDDGDDLDFNIIHAHTWEIAMISFVARYLRNIPYVYTIHDIIKGDPHGETNSSDIYAHGVLLEERILEHASKIIAVYEENRSFIDKVYPQHKEKVAVIPNGVDISTFTPNAKNQRYPKIGTDYVLFVGRTVKSKGIEFVVEAAKLLSDTIPFVFVLSTRRWDGEKHVDADHYIDMVRDLQSLRRSVHLIVDEWDRCALAGLYSNALVTIAPSLYEPGGMVTLESHASGTPVITNSIGFMKVSVRDGVDGIVLPDADDVGSYVSAMSNAISRFAESKHLGKEMGGNGRKRAIKEFSWTARADDHIALYSEVIEEVNLANSPDLRLG